jgi:hypothetical protein
MRRIKTFATFPAMTIKGFILSKSLGTKRDAATDTTDQPMGSPQLAVSQGSGREHRGTQAPSHLCIEDFLQNKTFQQQ